MQRFNAKIINMSQKKNSRVTGMLRTGDVDLNDVICYYTFICDDYYPYINDYILVLLYHCPQGICFQH